MTIYHKIQTVYKRDPATKYKTLLLGQYSKEEFEYLRNCQWIFTEKVDGMNIRVFLDDNGNAAYRGRTDKAQLPTGLSAWLARSLSDDNLKHNLGPGTCLYGEGYGPAIQKGGKYGIEQRFVLFDIFYKGHWLPRIEVEYLAHLLDIDYVPIIGRGTLDEMVEMAREGFNSAWGNFLAEGIVARPAIEMLNGWGERVITKIKHKDFRC